MKKKTFGQPNKSLPGRISSYLRGHQKIILIGAGFTYILLSFLTFNLRVSEGGDDSAYIIRALRLFEEGRFPKFQGPLYPSILSILVALTGLNIVVLKISSWVFLTISLLLLLKSYSKEASTITIAATGMLLILNHHFLYFGSQTYSEAFFMALQAGFLLFLFHTIQWQKQHRVRITQTAILALFLVSLYLTRTVAIVATPAIIIYFMTQKQWRALLYTTLFVTLFLSAYFLILNTIINIDPTGNDQLTSLLQKHPYDKSQGMETSRVSLLGFGKIPKFIYQNISLFLQATSQLCPSQNPHYRPFYCICFSHGELFGFIKKPAVFILHRNLCGLFGRTYVLCPPATLGSGPVDYPLLPPGSDNNYRNHYRPGKAKGTKMGTTNITLIDKHRNSPYRGPNPSAN
ncbi:hypothetical protein [Marinilabilia salmonicolor]|uniref:hypothetical protein n=1 Tax=Marinilabilia salmonicolor TaxID=989 RepID=UPI0011DF0D28|nr:hypothetical protein [Marinilabilia salmonicolor]